MSNVTVKLLLRESKKRSDGCCPVYLRITANRRSRYKSTGIYLRPRHWNERRQEVRKTHELATAYNDRIRSLRIKAEKAALEADTARAVKARLDGSGGSLTDYFEGYVGRLRRRDQYWQRKKFKTALNKLQAALGREKLDWSDLDREALEKLERYCREERGNNPNTTRKELERVRRVVREAVKDGVIPPSKNAFLRYDLPQGVPPERRRLTREEMQAIEAVELPEGSDLALTRDVFVFSFYTGGTRFSDVAALREENVREGHSRLRYTMMKTSEPVDLPLPPPAQTIIKRWENGSPFLFPLLSEGDDARGPVHLRKRIASELTQFNRRIKKVAREAEIDNPDEISSHVARHSFASVARKTSGDLYAISRYLGHSSLQTTERYLNSFDRDATDALASELWGGDGDE